MRSMTDASRTPEVTAEAFMAAVSQLGDAYGDSISVEAVAWGEIRLRLRFASEFLRPGRASSGLRLSLRRDPQCKTLA